MIKLKLLDIVKESLPNFDGENSSDLIKAEKILKAQQKIDPEISLNDIENLILFFRENGNRFNIIFEDENLLKIFKNEYFKINSSHNRIFKIPEITSELKTFSEEYFESYIQVNIQNDDWENLRIFYKNYFPVISPLVKEHLIDQISQKNRLVRSIIPQPEYYNYLFGQYKHGINPHFYALQSDIDSYYFNSQILEINNNICRHQNIEAFLKAFLGRIFVALGHFDAYTEDLRNTLKENSQTGSEWIAKESPFFPKNLEKEIEQTNQKMQQSIIDFRHEIAKKKANSEWIATIGYYIITIVLFGFFLRIGKYVFLTVFIVEIIVFLVVNKKIEKRYNQQFEKINNSTLEKIKKFGYKLIHVHLYTLKIWAFIAILGALISAWYVQPILGLLLTIGIPFIIRKIRKQK